jgi:hypothetical protein
MPHRSRRGGVKRRLQLLKFAHTAATACLSPLLGSPFSGYFDPEYEALFAAHNPSVCEVDRREGYNPHKAWPFILTPVDTILAAPAPAGYSHPRDSRILGYAIAWARNTPC